jgi:hypothetical protein
VVPGGGLAPDGSRWIACKPGFFLPVRVLSRLFRRLFLDRLAAAHGAGRLAFHGDLAPLADPAAFAAHLAPLRRSEWVVYAKRPFAGPEAVLAYLSRYTHRVAIANSRLLALDERGVTFRWKDYRARDGATGGAWIKTMTLSADEFIRRFLLHVLPSGFHRIRHYGLFASATRRANIAHVRDLLAAPAPANAPEPAPPPDRHSPCPCCGGRMTILETFGRWMQPRGPPSASAPTGTSVTRHAFSTSSCRSPQASAGGSSYACHDDRHLSPPYPGRDLPITTPTALRSPSARPGRPPRRPHRGPRRPSRPPTPSG